MTFSVFFFPLGEQKSRIKKIRWTCMLQKKTLFKNPDFKAISLFRINSCLTSIRKIYSLVIQLHHVKPRVLNLPLSFDKHRKRRSPHSTENHEHNITQSNALVLKIQNYCLRAEHWMGTTFSNFSWVIKMKIWPWRATKQNETKNNAGQGEEPIMCSIFSRSLRHVQVKKAYFWITLALELSLNST